MKISKVKNKKSAKKYFKVTTHNKNFFVNQKSFLGKILKNKENIKFISEVFVSAILLLGLFFGFWAIFSGIELMRS